MDDSCPPRLKSGTLQVNDDDVSYFHLNVPPNTKKYPSNNFCCPTFMLV